MISAPPPTRLLQRPAIFHADEYRSKAFIRGAQPGLRRAAPAPTARLSTWMTFRTRVPSVPLPRMHSGFTTRAAMCGNGARTSTTTRSEPMSYAALRIGISRSGSFSRRAARATNRTITATPSASVWSWRPRRRARIAERAWTHARTHPTRATLGAKPFEKWAKDSGCHDAQRRIPPA